MCLCVRACADLVDFLFVSVCIETYTNEQKLSNYISVELTERQTETYPKIGCTRCLLALSLSLSLSFSLFASEINGNKTKEVANIYKIVSPHCSPLIRKKGKKPKTTNLN